MRQRSVISVTVSGLSALGLYRYRRRLLSRLLGLPLPSYEVAVERGLRIPMPDGPSSSRTATIRALLGASPRSWSARPTGARRGTGLW